MNRQEKHRTAWKKGCKNANKAWWRDVKTFLQKQRCAVESEVHVNRTPTRIACTDAHSVSQHILNRLPTFHHANTRGSRAGRLRIAHYCVQKQLSSSRHVSFLAAPDTDHKHKFSLTCPSDNLTDTHKTFGTRSTHSLRSSTAEWRIETNPISHRL